MWCGKQLLNVGSPGRFTSRIMWNVTRRSHLNWDLKWNDTNISFMHLTCVETAGVTWHSLVGYGITSSRIKYGTLNTQSAVECNIRYGVKDKGFETAKNNSISGERTCNSGCCARWDADIVQPHANIWASSCDSEYFPKKIGRYVNAVTCIRAPISLPRWWKLNFK